MNVREITACRSCGSSDLTTVLDLGKLAVSDFLDAGQEPDRAPLELVRCAGCTLVQLRHTVDRDRLYRTYHYRSGVNETMVAALADVVADATKRVTLEPGDAVLDIGCNDGTLLGFYPRNVHRIGFDPSDVAREAWLANDYGWDLVRSFFPYEQQHKPKPCKIVTAIACFYDLDDPNAFLSEVKRWLHPEGVLVLQFQDLDSMVLANGFDNICHEHLTYWGAIPLGQALRRHGLQMVASEWSQVNGGSIRLFIQHGVSNRPNWGTHHVWRCLSDHSPDLAGFAGKIALLREETGALLEIYRRQGKRVLGIAASTKFSTLSQFYGLGPAEIQAIGERSPAKLGKRTVTGIPIISEEQMRAERPDFLFCCAWQFSDAFAQREAELLANGTRLIVPLPNLRLVGAKEATSADVYAQVA